MHRGATGTRDLIATTLVSKTRPRSTTSSSLNNNNNCLIQPSTSTCSLHAVIYSLFSLIINNCHKQPSTTVRSCRSACPSLYNNNNCLIQSTNRQGHAVNHSLLLLNNINNRHNQHQTIARPSRAKRSTLNNNNNCLIQPSTVSRSLHAVI